MRTPGNGSTVRNAPDARCMKSLGNCCLRNNTGLMISSSLFTDFQQFPLSPIQDQETDVVGTDPAIPIFASFERPRSNVYQGNLRRSLCVHRERQSAPSLRRGAERR